jgi:hypothetical protein
MATVPTIDLSHEDDSSVVHNKEQQRLTPDAFLAEIHRHTRRFLPLVDPAFAADAPERLAALPHALRLSADQLRALARASHAAALAQDRHFFTLLLPGAWLTDENINAFGELLARDDSHGRVLFKDSYYLTTTPALRALGTTERTRVILIPWHCVGGTHWALVVCDCVARRVRVYDSMTLMGHDAPRPPFWHALVNVLPPQPQGGEWRWGGFSTQFPQQEDSSACGVFVLAAMHAQAHADGPKRVRLAGQAADAARADYAYMIYVGKQPALYSF